MFPCDQSHSMLVDTHEIRLFQHQWHLFHPSVPLCLFSPFSHTSHLEHISLPFLPTTFLQLPCLPYNAGVPGSDYINANYVDGYRRQNAYIATQGSLPETFGEFWRMVWEQHTANIIMMTKLEEKSRVRSRRADSIGVGESKDRVAQC